jgi:hypothetical protein
VRKSLAAKHIGPIPCLLGPHLARGLLYAPSVTGPSSGTELSLENNHPVFVEQTIMKSLSRKSRNGFGRSLRFESLETRRLLSADLSLGMAHAAKLIHHESSNAAEVGKADPGGDTHATGRGKHVALSSVNHISSTSQVKVHAALSVAKRLAVPAVSKALSQTVTHHDDSAGSSNSASTGKTTDTKSEIDDTSNSDGTGISGTNTADDNGETDKENSGSSTKETHPETETETETETNDNSSSLN